MTVRPIFRINRVSIPPPTAWPEWKHLYGSGPEPAGKLIRLFEK